MSRLTTDSLDCSVAIRGQQDKPGSYAELIACVRRVVVLLTSGHYVHYRSLGATGYQRVALRALLKPELCNSGQRNCITGQAAELG